MPAAILCSQGHVAGSETGSSSTNTWLSRCSPVQEWIAGHHDTPQTVLAFPDACRDWRTCCRHSSVQIPDATDIVASQLGVQAPSQGARKQLSAPEAQRQHTCSCGAVAAPLGGVVAPTVKLEGQGDAGKPGVSALRRGAEKVRDSMLEGGPSGDLPFPPSRLLVLCSRHRRSILCMAECTAQWHAGGRQYRDSSRQAASPWTAGQAGKLTDSMPDHLCGSMVEAASPTQLPTRRMLGAGQQHEAEARWFSAWVHDPRV